MNRYLYLPFAFLIFLHSSTFAVVKDSNVVISNSKEDYIFNYIKKDKNVIVKQYLTTTYQCRDYRT